MKEIQLIRKSQDGYAVYGQVDIPVGSDLVRVATLENAAFLIPEGRFTLEMTWSPRFQKDMPLISGVPDRDGIRFHVGSRPEHSQGCVLVSPFGLSTIKGFINTINKFYENEKITLSISRVPQPIRSYV